MRIDVINFYKDEFEERNLSTHPNPCCSKQCGYKKGVLTRKSSKVEVP